MWNIDWRAKNGNSHSMGEGVPNSEQSIECSGEVDWNWREDSLPPPGRWDWTTDNGTGRPKQALLSPHLPRHKGLAWKNIPGHRCNEPARVFLSLLELEEVWGCHKASYLWLQVAKAPSEEKRGRGWWYQHIRWSRLLSAFRLFITNNLLPMPRYLVFFLIMGQLDFSVFSVFLADNCKQEGQSIGAEIEDGKR